MMTYPGSTLTDDVVPLPMVYIGHAAYYSPTKFQETTDGDVQEIAVVFNHQLAFQRKGYMALYSNLCCQLIVAVQEISLQRRLRKEGRKEEARKHQFADNLQSLTNQQKCMIECENQLMQKVTEEIWA